MGIILRDDGNAVFCKSLLLITLLALAVRSYGLSSQPLSKDDVGVAFSAFNYMEEGHLGPTMWNHPDLRNIVVYLSLHAFGPGVWPLKLPSIVFGAFSVPLLGLAARRLLRNHEMALMAAFFLALDPLHIDYSRQAVQEVYMAFFTLSGILLSLLYKDNGNPFFVVLGGICFGLGIASKWYVVVPLAVTCVFLLLFTFDEKKPRQNSRPSRTLLVSLALGLLPFTVYLLTFLPWFNRGYGISDWLFLQTSMLRETSIHTGYNAFELDVLDHEAWHWFIKPAVYVDFIFSAGKPAVLLGMANPLVWLLTIPSILFLVYKSIRDRNRGLGYLACLFWISYLPFLVARRPIWAHTAFSVLPFAFMAVAYALWKTASSCKKGRTMLLVYLLTITIATIPLYLLATGKGLETTWLAPLFEAFRPDFEH